MDAMEVAPSSSQTPTENAPANKHSPTDALSYADSLRQAYLRQIPYRTALLDPAGETLSYLFQKQQPQSPQYAFRFLFEPGFLTVNCSALQGEECYFDALLMEIASTWLLMASLFEESFEPVECCLMVEDDEENDDGVGSEDVANRIMASPEMQHYARAMSWLQLELRRRIYTAELRGEQPPGLTAVQRSTIVSDSGPCSSRRMRSEDENHEELFKECIRFVTAGEFLFEI